MVRCMQHSSNVESRIVLHRQNFVTALMQQFLRERESYMLASMPERPHIRPNPSLIATRPDINATVSASAGSGKTWLLVTRIVRLLLAGAEPGTILALTFTRKAAAEMQLRLRDRLYQMATVDDDTLKELLAQIDADTSAETLARARSLYEQLLHALYPVRLRTFHSFCQDILARFPLEADIPPGFELLEDTSLLLQQAWEALFAEATRAPDGELASALDVLMIAANGPANTRTALFSMLDHRSDWWAYTENNRQPVRFARQQLEKHLQFDNTTDPLVVFFNDVMRQHLNEFSLLLRKHSTATNEKHAALIESVSERVEFDLSDFNKLCTAFLTATNAPRARKSSKSQQKNMGADAENRFLELHELICQQCLAAIEHQLRQQSYRINAAWYFAGAGFIELFQRLKREQRLLDFTDLEWNCYQLLNSSDNALWVQYKVDQRIDHILIDEFQDTNPTQWHLLAPLLEEMAASNLERWRSVFLVGDEKQSIYAFRRANPALQSQASAWLAEHLAAIATPLDFSWRSSPAIIDFVNAVFSSEEVRQQLPGFSLHDTHLKNLPGAVTLMPLFREDDIAEIAHSGLRNPLLQPRPPALPSAHDKEAQWLANEIRQLVSSGRAAYGDILILTRNRSHIAAYENALRHQQIPFIGNQRGSLLQNLEIQDLEKLLDTLITPFDNLALAQVLKSPIFAASDTDLMSLASLARQPGKHRWYPHLLTLAETLPGQHPLARAASLLQAWRALADTVPVHDLLDHIFAEGNIIARYTASLPGDQQQRASANLHTFLELSLDIDSGRYPSLTHFLHRLRNLRQFDNSAPDEPVNNSPDCVRFLTIHASKGLEAPIIFLIDCNSAGGHHDAYSALVDWPADRDRPALFQLTMSRANTDSITSSIQEKKAQAQERENLNLLYVAITRARQFLYISGAASNRSSRWLSLLESGMQTLCAGEPGTMMTHSVGKISKGVRKTEPPASTSISTKFDAQLLAQLRQPIARLPRARITLAPSHSDSSVQINSGSSDVDARLRGQVIHRALELLCTKQIAQPALCAQLAAEFAISDQDVDLQNWCQEAQANISNPALADIFQPQQAQAFNECPILYRHEKQDVYGIIDRLVVTEKQILLIDYKTHQLEDPARAEIAAQDFTQQLALYRYGVERLWPRRTIRSGVLFTACQQRVWLQ